MTSSSPDGTGDGLGAAPDDAPGRPGGRSRFKDLPTWVQAVTAILGVVIAAIGVTLTGIQIMREPTPAPTPIVVKPEAFIQQVTIDAGEVKARGEFRNVDLAAEVILFVGRPDGVVGAPWLPVEARVSSSPSSTSGARVNGGWDALRPIVERGRFTWQAFVVPAGSGATDGYADIRTRGPDSSLVLAASEPFRTEE
jgi:hypothetical protein